MARLQYLLFSAQDQVLQCTG